MREQTPAFWSIGLEPIFKKLPTPDGAGNQAKDRAIVHADAARLELFEINQSGRTADHVLTGYRPEHIQDDVRLIE